MNEIVELELLPGRHIQHAVDEAIAYAAARERHVAFDFNGVRVTVAGDGDPALVLRDWERAMDGCIGRQVGPVHRAVLSDEELGRDASVRAERQARWDRRMNEDRAERERMRLATDAEIAGVGFSMALPDGIARWAECEAANRGSGYGMAVLNYAERWARLMEARMARGAGLVEVARATGCDADVEGISVFQHGCAVAILSVCWKHGAGLRVALGR